MNVEQRKKNLIVWLMCISLYVAGGIIFGLVFYFIHIIPAAVINCIELELVTNRYLKFTKRHSKKSYTIWIVFSSIFVSVINMSVVFILSIIKLMFKNSVSFSTMLKVFLNALKTNAGLRLDLFVLLLPVVISSLVFCTMKLRAWFIVKRKHVGAELVRTKNVDSYKLYNDFFSKCIEIASEYKIRRDSFKLQQKVEKLKKQIRTINIEVKEEIRTIINTEKEFMYKEEEKREALQLMEQIFN